MRFGNRHITCSLQEFTSNPQVRPLKPPATHPDQVTDLLRRNEYLYAAYGLRSGKVEIVYIATTATLEAFLQLAYKPNSDVTSLSWYGVAKAVHATASV